MNKERVGLNGVTGVVGINAAVEYLTDNPNPRVALAAGNDISLSKTGKGGEVDPAQIKLFARHLAEFGNQGRRLLGEPIRAFDRMAVVRVIEAHHNSIVFVVDHYGNPEQGEVKKDGEEEVDLQLSAIARPAEIPWAAAGVSHVVDATTAILTGEQVREHVRGSVRHAIKTAPAKGEFDHLWVAGVNDLVFKPDEHKTIAEGACTLQVAGALLAPLFEASIQPKNIIAYTIHGVTGDQPLVRRFRPDDPPRGEPGGANIVRTKSGGAGDLAGLVRYLANRNLTYGPTSDDIRNAKIDVLMKKSSRLRATRVPAFDSALIDFVIVNDGRVDRERLADRYRQFSERNPRVLRVEESPYTISSSRIQGQRESGIVYLDQLEVCGADDDIVLVTGAYAHEANTPRATVDISSCIQQSYE